MLNVASFLFFAVSSARRPATHLNRRCACGTDHGPTRRGWSSELGRMATAEEFLAAGQHGRCLEAARPDRVWGRKKRQKAGHDNGPLGARGRVFQALARSNYPGTVHLLRPDRQGCWR